MALVIKSAKCAMALLKCGCEKSDDLGRNTGNTVEFVSVT